MTRTILSYTGVIAAAVLIALVLVACAKPVTHVEKQMYRAVGTK